MTGQRPAGRAKRESQSDLFEARGLTDAGRVETPPVQNTPLVPAGLTDEALIAMLPQASMLAAEGHCSEVASRGLVEAVPALEQLWRHFAGFGIVTPLMEQRAVLNMLARLDCAAARTALRGIVLSKGLPASLLPAASGAAAEAALSLPAGFIGPLLEHEDAEVRAAAFALAPRAGVPVELLRDGLGDPSTSVRRLAAIAMGNAGDNGATAPLAAELARKPSAAVIEALASIGDEDAIVHLGRCAERHPALAGMAINGAAGYGHPKGGPACAPLGSTWRDLGGWAHGIPSDSRREPMTGVSARPCAASLCRASHRRGGTAGRA